MLCIVLANPSSFSMFSQERPRTRSMGIAKCWCQDVSRTCRWSKKYQRCTVFITYTDRIWSHFGKVLPSQWNFNDQPGGTAPSFGICLSAMSSGIPEEWVLNFVPQSIPRLTHAEGKLISADLVVRCCEIVPLFKHFLAAHPLICTAFMFHNELKSISSKALFLLCDTKARRTEFWGLVSSVIVIQSWSLLEVRAWAC